MDQEMKLLIQQKTFQVPSFGFLKCLIITVFQVKIKTLRQKILTVCSVFLGAYSKTQQGEDGDEKRGRTGKERSKEETEEE